MFVNPRCPRRLLLGALSGTPGGHPSERPSLAFGISPRMRLAVPEESSTGTIERQNEFSPAFLAEIDGRGTTGHGGGVAMFSPFVNPELHRLLQIVDD